MNFGQSIQSVFNNYANFSGRARRSEYWWFYLFAVVVAVVAGFVDAVLGPPILEVIAFLALIVPGIAVTVRRLHDTGRSGWWIFFGLVPIAGPITLIVFYCLDSEGDNRYGPAPKWAPQRAW